MRSPVRIWVTAPKKPVILEITGFFLLSEMPFRKPDAPKTPLRQIMSALDSATCRGYTDDITGRREPYAPLREKPAQLQRHKAHRYRRDDRRPHRVGGVSGVSEGIFPPSHAYHRAHHVPDHVLLHRRVVYFFAIDRVYGILQMGVALSLPVLRLYNGQRGKSPAVNRFMRWFFYLYYPAHLLLIGLLIHV